MPCKDIAECVLAVAQDGSPRAYDLSDLAEIALPFLHDHTTRRSRLAQSYDGFVFVMPQYNRGYTAVVKNAVDFLYAEWHDKAASIVTYGSHGGARGVDQ